MKRLDKRLFGYQAAFIIFSIFFFLTLVHATDFHILSGSLPDTYTDPGRGSVTAIETSGANNGNWGLFAGTYSMALFPGNYDVYANLSVQLTVGFTHIRTPVQNTTISDHDEMLDIVVLPNPLYHLKGRVVDISGAGIANVDVTAHDGDIPFNSICICRVYTDANGDYDCSVVEGDYRMQFEPLNNSNFLQETQSNIQVKGDTVREDVILTSGNSTLSGSFIHDNYTLLEAFVMPVEVGGNGYVSYNSIWGDRYAIPLPEGSYSIYSGLSILHPPNFDTGNYSLITLPNQTVSVIGDTVFDIVVPSYNFYLVSGTVTDINGDKQPNVNLFFADQNDEIFGVSITNDEGVYNMSLPAGTYELKINPPPVTYPPFTIHNFVVTGGHERNIRLSLEYTLIEEAIAQLPPDLELNLDVFDIINEADTLNYDIVVQGAKELLQIILNWGGSEMTLVLRKPDGTVYGEYSSTEPPINIEVPNADEGTWRCEVTAVEVPHANYPFALAVGVSPNQPPVADADGPYSGSVDSPVNFDGSGSHDLDGEIAFYEWDWDNNGTFDDKTEASTITYTWNTPFSGIIGLRVTDNEGAADYASAQVEITPDPLDLDDDGDGFSENEGDCDDGAVGISPVADEICGDGIDNNCNEQTDEGCGPVPGDIDGDGDCDVDDYGLFRLCLGKCIGDEGFLVDVDYDGDGCITYSDYRIWYGLFKNQ